VTFQHESNQVYSTTDLKGYPGNSGGPLCVQLVTNSQARYYPAAVYLGATGRTAVRAIDSAVANLINCAEILAISDATASDPIPLAPGQNVPTNIYGFVTIHLVPREVTNFGGGFRFKESTNGTVYTAQTNLFAVLGGGQYNLGPSYTVRFLPIQGFLAPPDQIVAVKSGQRKDIYGYYQAWGGLHRLGIEGNAIWVTGSSGSTYRVEYTPRFELSNNWAPLRTQRLSSSQVLLTNVFPAPPSNRFLRAVLVP
jgi:hypothetical protein